MLDYAVDWETDGVWARVNYIIKEPYQMFLAGQIDVDTAIANIHSEVPRRPPSFPAWRSKYCAGTGLSIMDTATSNALVAFGFVRLWAPDKKVLFRPLLSTMMISSTVMLIPMFVLFFQLFGLTTPTGANGFFTCAMRRTSGRSSGRCQSRP